MGKKDMTQPIGIMAPSKLDTNVLFDDSSDDENPAVQEQEPVVFAEEDKIFNEKTPDL